MMTRCCAGLLLLASGAWSQAEAPRYHFVDLGRLTNAEVLNDVGDVAGTITFPSTAPTIDAGFHAFLFSHDHLRDLGTLSGEMSSPQALTATGQVLGYFRHGYWDNRHHRQFWVHAFLTEDGTPIDLSSQCQTATGPLERPSDINAQGEIIGQVKFHPYLWSHGQMIEIGPLPTGAHLDLRAINDRSEIFGILNIRKKEGSAWHTEGNRVVVYARGQFRDIAVFDDKTSIRYITKSGDILGSLESASGQRHAFSYHAGQASDLGVLAGYQDGVAEGMNDQGLIVGSGSTIIGYDHQNPIGPIYVKGAASLYQDGRWIDLNRCIDLGADAKFELINATSINHSRQIIGKAMAPDGYHGFLLTPIAGTPGS